MAYILVSLSGTHMHQSYKSAVHATNARLTAVCTQSLCIANKDSCPVMLHSLKFCVPGCVRNPQALYNTVLWLQK